MRQRMTSLQTALVIVGAAMLVSLMPVPAQARPSSARGLNKVNHIIIAMQENHSFDNYFGALPYHSQGRLHYRHGPCKSNDHACVNGLSCRRDRRGNYTCSNSNRDDDGCC